MNITHQDAIQWTVDYFDQKGLRLQPNEQNNMILAWSEYVKSLTQKAKKSEDKPIVGEVNSGGFIGFTTGENKSK